MAGIDWHDREMVIDFCYDDLGQYGIGYPNLAKPGLDPDQFDHEWPRVIPLRLLLHLQSRGIPTRAHLLAHAPPNSWYPVAFAWFDFTCDYFALMRPLLLDRLRDRIVRVLFYYHEGDNPSSMINRLHWLCDQHRVPRDCFLLVSANSAADQLDHAVYFADHEYFFRWINRHQHPNTDRRLPTHVFTALNRTHKTWRACVMSDLVRDNLLRNSLWSYNCNIQMQAADHEHPLDLSQIPDWPEATDRFIKDGPYICDSADGDAMNDHRSVNSALYTQALCHIVIETFIDADGSGGAFLTEKTYKCIKYGQPFVIIGTAGSLAQLRRDGYRTFDHVIDPTYDTISDATQRYLEIKRVLVKIHETDPVAFFDRCQDDISHNQKIFLDGYSEGLNRLVDRLT